MTTEDLDKLTDSDIILLDMAKLCTLEHDFTMFPHYKLCNLLWQAFNLGRKYEQDLSNIKAEHE